MTREEAEVLYRRGFQQGKADQASGDFDIHMGARMRGWLSSGYNDSVGEYRFGQRWERYVSKMETKAESWVE